LRLTTSILILVACLWSFGGLLEDVFEAETLVRWDLGVAQWLHAHQSASVVAFFQAVTQFGEPVLWVIVLLVTVWLVSRHEILLLWAWLAANFGGLLLQVTLKGIARRTRPEFASAHLRDTSYSFPSGHAMAATIAYFMLAYIACTTFGWRGRMRVAAYASAAAMTLMIALSRLVLGVHFPSDVIAGLAAGGAWLAACFSILDVIRWRTTRRVRRESI